MRLIAAATLMLIPLAAAASQPQPRIAAPAAAQVAPKPACDRFARMDRASGAIHLGQVPGVQRLDRLPPADLHLSVERNIGGCHVPVIVRQDFRGAR
jgi:hypothetical protein